MHSHGTLWRATAAAVLAGTATAVAAALAAPPSDGRESFRRPAALVDDGSAARNLVWQLGRQLFFDASLSGSGRTSCATCHQVALSWSDTRPKAIGDNGRALPFKAPTLFNVGGLDRLGWTGKFADTASVSFFAMSSAANMNMPLTELVRRLRVTPTYVAAFRAAFGHDVIMQDDVAAAITRYVNSITSAEAPFDRWVEGDEAAISSEAKRGFAVFNGKARCSECHSGWSLTDGSFHDIGTSENDPGRGAFFKTSVKLQHAFKTPTLRGVAERAPYFHDGSRATLEDVIDLYDRGGIARPSRAEAIQPLGLSPAEKAELKAFLTTLSGGTAFVMRPEAAPLASN